MTARVELRMLTTVRVRMRGVLQKVGSAGAWNRRRTSERSLQASLAFTATVLDAVVQASVTDTLAGRVSVGDLAAGVSAR